MEKKILVAVDGSVYSSNSLDYLIRLFGKDQDFAIDLLSIVRASGTDQNWMREVDPLRRDSPEVERKTSKAVKYLKDAKARLVRNGFDEERISFSTKNSTGIDIASAIHQEAAKGMYDALLIGRRGVGMVGEMFFGSVSSSLVNRCHDVPIWIIDGEITSTNFLLGVHCMLESLIAADHLAYIISGTPEARVYLYHSKTLLGAKPKFIRDDFNMLWGEQWCDQHLDPDNHLFNAHTQLLLDNGVKPEQITRLPTQTGLDASHDLLRQARKQHCGTIVIGRRPRESEKGVFGGVSDRTMQQAQDIAVWLVG